VLKVTISGIRGIVDESLTDEVVQNFAQAFGTYLNGGKVVVGSDTRKSGEKIKKIVLKALQSCGCEVIDLGISTTPTVGILTTHFGAAGGMVITASHNPNPWNGLKFIASDGIFLTPKEFEKFVKIYESKRFIKKKQGKISAFADANEVHIKRIRKTIDLGLIRERKFTVVLDSCNGAGSIITPKLLKELGVKVIAINTKIGVDFPHGPEPTPENLKELSKAVINNKADIGFAQDPDADRLSIVTNKGEAISEEYTLAIAAKYVLSKNVRTGRDLSVVANLSTSNLLDDVAKEYGAKIIRTKIGEVHVACKIKSSGAQIGGEGNGGVIYPKIGFNRDSLVGIALILSYLAESKKKIDQIFTELPKYYLYKTKIKCLDLVDAKSILEKAENLYKNSKIDKTEGVKILLEDAWIHLRASNTEPILRIFCEARDPSYAKKLAEEIKSALKA